MPQDEFDFEDPLELNGVAFLIEEDTSAQMAECFAEEFMRMGYNHKQVLALFRNPQYVGPNMLLLNKGGQFVRDIIAETFAQWGRPVAWSKSQPVQSALFPQHDPGPLTPSLSPSAGERVSAWTGEGVVHGEGERGVCDRGAHACAGSASAQEKDELDDTLTDPMGNPIPNLR